HLRHLLDRQLETVRYLQFHFLRRRSRIGRYDDRVLDSKLRIFELAEREVRSNTCQYENECREERERATLNCGCSQAHWLVCRGEAFVRAIGSATSVPESSIRTFWPSLR